MILRNDTDTFTAEHENAIARPVYNTNTAITIGGIVKSQVDSRRLEITSTIRIPTSSMASLNAVLENYTLELYYTPNCPLYDQTAAEEIKVIMTNDPQIDQRIYLEDKVYYITFQFEQVLSG